MDAQALDSHPLVTKIREMFSRDLVRENDFLRQENRILRSKLGTRAPLTEEDRRTLVQYGMPIKDRLADVISVVKPETLLGWHRRMKREKWTYGNVAKARGRPRKGPDTEAIVLRLARENAWGYDRIAGEMGKLGHTVSKSYVRDLLKANGLPVSPERKGMSWKQFIQSHLDTTWAADFFTEEIWSMSGLVTCYVLVFIHLGSRRVYIPGCTPHPNATWTRQQARNFLMHVDEIGLPCSHLIHDRDSSFLPFDDVLQSANLAVVKTPPKTPICNAYAERFVREVRETLDNLILVGEGQLHRAVKHIEHHHNLERPHQGIGNAVPAGHSVPEVAVAPDAVRSKSRLGDLLNHYFADAA